MAQATVKLVADITPALKADLDKAAAKHKLTIRAAVEEALGNWVMWANGKGQA